MISIKFNDIKIKSASNHSGVFVGNNFEPNWDAFSKSNTNVSGDNVSDSVNIVIDEDGFDFTIFEEEIADERSITQVKDQSNYSSSNHFNKSSKKNNNNNSTSSHTNSGGNNDTKNKKQGSVKTSIRYNSKRK